MIKTEDNFLTSYKDIETLDNAGRVKLVLHTGEKKVYVKKIVDRASGEIYRRLKSNGMDKGYFPAVKEITETENVFVVIEEYISGETLCEKVEKNGPVDKDTAKRYICEVLTAVGMLHKMGIVHRDITENNVMTDNDDNIKIIDFNISRNADANKKKDTQIMGTQGYAAPEQFGFFRSDERTDIYSIGVLYNFLLTGSTDLNIHRDDKKADKVIKKCTEFSPVGRYKSCAEVIKDMGAPKERYDIEKAEKHSIVIMTIEKVIFFIGCVMALNEYTHGKTLPQSIGMVTDTFFIMVLPFILIGNVPRWQERTPLKNLHSITKCLIGIVLWLVVCAVYFYL